MGDGTGMLSISLIKNKAKWDLLKPSKWNLRVFQSCYIHSYVLDLQKNVSYFIIVKFYEKITCVIIHLT